MEDKPKNRGWVKNAAIIFLLILLILTFFSNTIMNRSLTEVATAGITDGTITAKVRGTGTVIANGRNTVTAGRVVDIKAVMVKVGQEVEAGDVLFVLGAGDGDELEAAQEELNNLQMSYQRAAISFPNTNYDKDNQRIAAAKRARDDAKNALKVAEAQAKPIKEIKDKIDEYQTIINKYDADLKTAQLAVEEAQAKYDAEMPQAPVKPQPPEKPDETVTPDNEENREIWDKYREDLKVFEEESKAYPGKLDKYNQDLAVYKASGENKKALDAAKEALKEVQNRPKEEYNIAKSKIEELNAQYEAMIKSGGEYVANYSAALAAYEAAQSNYDALVDALDTKVESDNKSSALASLDLQEIAVKIQKQKEKISELSGESGSQITANVAGRIDSVECTAGQTVTADQVLCAIEVPDMGYSLNFSVTNDQARRLRVGESASVSNYYWGKEIIATLTSIITDPKNPQNNKLLSFDITGDVNAGAELNISIGQKSAGYDVVVPNSSIRNDSNGSFVLKIEAKNSPLGNRYIARRVEVEVLASDDMNSAVNGDLGYGDFVITTSSGPVKNGDQVRMTET